MEKLYKVEQKHIHGALGVYDMTYIMAHSESEARELAVPMLKTCDPIFKGEVRICVHLA